MVKLSYRLKASTLIESLIAMVIIVVCLVVGTMVYTNVLDSDKQRNRLKAMLMINKEVLEIKSGKNFLDAEKQTGDWTIKTTVEKYDQTDHIYKLSVSIMDQNKKIIALRNELIPVE